MIKCVVIDDEQPAINVLVNYIKRVNELELVGTCTNAQNGVELIKQADADVVFLDIQMDEMTGIEVINMIGPKTQVIFCTAFSEFAVESYELNALDYLMKPISFNRFIKAVKKIRHFPGNAEKSGNEDFSNDYIFVKTGVKGKMLKINLDEIEYIEAKNNYVAIYNKTQAIMVYSTLKDIENSLSPANFIRVHKSFIIPVSKISVVEKNYLMIKDRKEHIPISKTYKPEFINLVRNKLLTYR